MARVGAGQVAYHAGMHFELPRHQALWTRVSPRLPDDDISHDRDHVLRVYAWALELAPEAGADPDLAGAAALVHDLVNLSKNDPDRARAGERSADASREVLAEAGYNPEEIARIADAVRTSNWSAGLEASESLGVVLQDADRLDALGAIGVFRTFACAQRLVHEGRKLRFAADEDPLADQGREPDDTRYALDHFPVKLLRLADGMHFDSSRREARLRHAAMIDLLQALRRELGNSRR